MLNVARPRKWRRQRSYHVVTYSTSNVYGVGYYANRPVLLVVLTFYNNNNNQHISRSNLNQTMYRQVGDLYSLHDKVSLATII